MRFELGAFVAAVDATRKELKYSWKTVADLVEVDHTAVQEIVRGRSSTLPLEIVAALAYWADIGLDEYVMTPVTSYCDEAFPVMPAYLCQRKLMHDPPCRTRDADGHYHWWNHGKA